MQTVLLLGLAAMVITGTHDFWDDGNNGGIRGGTVATLETHFDPTLSGPIGNHGPGTVPHLSHKKGGGSETGGGGGEGGTNITETPWPDQEHRKKYPDGFTCGNNTPGGEPGHQSSGPGKDPNVRSDENFVLYGDINNGYVSEATAGSALADSLSANQATLSYNPDLSQVQHLYINAHGMYDKGGHKNAILFAEQGPNGLVVQKYTVDEFVQYLQARNFNGKQITLVVCNTATDYGSGSYAERLYNKLQREVSVTGYPHYVHVDSHSGKITKFNKVLGGGLLTAVPITYGVKIKP